jgi:hypothetical protein
MFAKINLNPSPPPHPLSGKNNIEAIPQILFHNPKPIKNDDVMFEEKKVCRQGS